MASSDSKIEKIQTHFQVLSSVASTLNNASDELTKAVSMLDEALKKLNIGLTVWVTFRSRAVVEPEYDDDQIGYCKVNGKWGIALRRIWGDPVQDHYGDEGAWLFNDAPRDMRLHSVDKIPELIEALGKEASDTAQKINEKTREVSELASAIERIASEPKPKSLSDRIVVGEQPMKTAKMGTLRDLNPSSDNARSYSERVAADVQFLKSAKKGSLRDLIGKSDKGGK